MRDTDTLQAAVLAEDVTRPIYLVEMQYADEPEYLSTNGTQTVGLTTYTGSDVGVAGMGDWTQARIRLMPTPARSAALLSPDWRGQPCRIYLLPCSEYPEFIEPGYVEPAYALQGVVKADPMLLLDGVITGGSLGQYVELEISHRALLRRWTPRIRIAPPTCNHLPPPGTRLTWEGETFILEAR